MYPSNPSITAKIALPVVLPFPWHIGHTISSSVSCSSGIAGLGIVRSNLRLCLCELPVPPPASESVLGAWECEYGDVLRATKPVTRSHRVYPRFKHVTVAHG